MIRFPTSTHRSASWRWYVVHDSVFHRCLNHHLFCWPTVAAYGGHETIMLISSSGHDYASGNGLVDGSDRWRGSRMAMLHSGFNWEDRTVAKRNAG